MKKKLGIAIGIFFGLIVALMLIVPLVVNVDKYRPQIVEAVNKQINGNLELGKLSLSLWGQIRIEIDGLRLKDATGAEVMGVKNAFVHVPLLSLLSAAPVVTYKLDQPVIHVVKNRNGKLNLMTLTKPSKDGAPAVAPTPVPQATEGPKGTQGEKAGGMESLPAFVTRAKVGIELLHSLVTYQDEKTALSAQVKDLNFVARDISLSHPSQYEIWADLNTQLGQTFSLRGPARITGTATPELKGERFDRISLTTRLDMNDVEMTAPNLFEKKKGVPTEANLNVVASDKEINIQNLTARFADAELKVAGRVALPPTSDSPVPMGLNFTAATNDIDFKPWAGLIPSLKEYQLGGSARLDAKISGTSEKPEYSGKLKVVGLTAKAPKLKAQPKIDGEVSFMTDQIDKIFMTMVAPGNDLKVQGKVISFTRPRVDFDVTSSGMDLDQLVEFPPPAQKAKTAAGGDSKDGGGSPEKTAPSPSAPKADYDAALAPLRSNPIAAATIANLGINMKMIKAQGVKLSDIACKGSFKDLTLGMNSCGFKVFSGVIRTNALFNLKPKTPIYQLDTQVTGFDLAQAVESQMALFKNTIKGKADFNMTVQGASFNPDPAISNLKAKGNMKINDAVFATIDVMKMVGEALNKTFVQLGEKVPSLKGKTVGKLPDHSSQYESVISDFTIANGKFAAPNFKTKAKPNMGIDLKGDTTVGMKDYSLNATWEVVDTYNLTRLKDLSIEQNGVNVPHVLTQGNSPLTFPIHVGCTLSAPCYSYTEVPEYLAAIALKNASGALTGKAKEEARKKAESIIKQVAPPQMQDELQKKLKGFFN